MNVYNSFVRGNGDQHLKERAERYVQNVQYPQRVTAINGEQYRGQNERPEREYDVAEVFPIAAHVTDRVRAHCACIINCVIVVRAWRDDDCCSKERGNGREEEGKNSCIVSTYRLLYRKECVRIRRRRSSSHFCCYSRLPITLECTCPPVRGGKKNKRRLSLRRKLQFPIVCTSTYYNVSDNGHYPPKTLFHYVRITERESKIVVDEFLNVLNRSRSRRFIVDVALRINYHAV